MLYNQMSYPHTKVLELDFIYIRLYDTIYYHRFTDLVENSVDIDQLASGKPADQGPHCFRK